MSYIAREDAVQLLKKYNKDPFHIQHAYTVEAVMKWYAKELGYGDDAEYWGIVGLLHDIDFELYPEEHCLKAPELLREVGVSEDVIHSVVSVSYTHLDVYKRQVWYRSGVCGYKGRTPYQGTVPGIY